MCPCHYRVTCVLTLIGLRVVAWGSSEVLLSGLLDASHLSAKNQFRGMGLTSGRCPHDITDSYLLKMTPEPGSRLKFVDALTDGGGVMPTPDCRHPNPYCIVCVCRWTALRRIALRRILCMDSCRSLSAMPCLAGDFSLCPGLESWVCSSLPARSCASLAGSGLSVWLRWCWLLATQACHWVGIDCAIQKAKSRRTENPEFTNS